MGRLTQAQIWIPYNNVLFDKVEKIKEDRLDSIPSPSTSVKIQIIGGKSLLEVIRQNIAGWCQQTFCFEKFVDNAQQCFAFTPFKIFSTLHSKYVH